MSEKYDLIIIGAGPGGYTAAITAAQHGMKTALIEARETGGSCLNRGCIPVKTLLHSSGLYREMKNGGGVGVFADALRYDMGAIFTRKDEVVTGAREGVEALIKANKIDLRHGSAKILSAGKVLVRETSGDTVLDTAKILIATGAVPSRPPIGGIDLPGVVTSDELLEGGPADYKSLIIIGGGVIGAEFASFFSDLGCEVTIIEALERVLPTFDREISQNLSMILKRRGVKICTGCKVERISRTDGGLRCEFSGRAGAQEVTAQGVLVSVGRKANTKGLFADGLGIALRRGIVVDENFETGVKGIYAIGDVVDGGVQLAHAASAQAKYVVAVISGNAPETDLSVVPACVYTSPEIASVGITMEEAKARGISVKTGKYAMSGHAKTIIERQDRSFIKLIFDADTEKLLGAQLMCARASDLVSELSSAIVGGLTAKQLASVIRPHPTFSEAVTEAVEDAEGRAVHIMPKAKR